MQAWTTLGLPTIGPIMQALRLNEVLTRVVAWHNRHPLARRISASQVHSIGEVLLPFASAQSAPLSTAQAAAAPPLLQDLLDPAAAPSDQVTQPDSVPDDPALAPADLPNATADNIDDARAQPAPVLSMEEEADDLFSEDQPPAAEPATTADDGPEMLIELSDDADEPTQAQPVDSPLAVADAPAAAAAPDLTASNADSVEPAAPPAVDEPAAEPAPAPPADAEPPAQPRPGHNAAAAPPAGLLARLWAQIQGLRLGGTQCLPRLQATFSRDFIWPLRPGQVARWARRHGSLAPLAPADWPQRLIDTDGSLLAQARGQGLQHDLPLHVLTAAIGVGDRRIRVLIGAQGHVLGPRSYSRHRLAALAGLLALGLGGAGWGWLRRADSLSAHQALAVVAAAASAAAQAASAAELAAAAAAAADPVWRAQQAKLLLSGSAPSDLPPADAVQAGATDITQPAPHASEALAAPHEASAAPHPTSAQAADAGPAPRKPVVPLGTFVAELSAADKLAARQQVEAARIGQAAALAAQPPTLQAPVFAVVTLPTRERDSAARGLALIRASGQRLVGELPEHSELMQNRGQWRAAWWPFDSQVDAERARVMLAARGLKVEVVEF